MVTHRRLAAWAGIVAPVLFVGVFTAEGMLRSNYSARSMFVSELSMGERGWIQIVNFMLFGLLLFIFARALRQWFKNGGLSQVGPRLLTILAVSFFLSGPFVVDPGTIFTAQRSWHGILHGIFGAIIFLLMPVSCFVFARIFRQDPQWQPFGAWTLVAGTIIVAAVVLLTVAKAPAAQYALQGWLGLIQRAAIVPFMMWPFAFASRFARLEEAATDR